VTSYDQQYNQLLRTPEEALELIRPGDGIYVGTAAGSPEALMRALRGYSGFSNNRLYVYLPVHELPTDVDRADLEIISGYLSPLDRPLFQEGQIDLLPNHFSHMPRLISGLEKDHLVTMATVSPMDDQGYFSCGTNCDCTMPIGRRSNTLLLEVNENMPRTFGEHQFHINEVKDKKVALVENNVPIPELPTPEFSEAESRIGQIVAGLIENGDNLQVGFGALPGAVMKQLGAGEASEPPTVAGAEAGAVLGYLGEHTDLGIFSEALPEGIVDLYEKGVITNRSRRFYQGKSVVAFAMGTRRLYDFIHENPHIYMMPIDYTNNVNVVSEIENFVSVNATVEVDFLGQASSEMVGGRYYSSTGGQSELSRGAWISKHGKGILVTNSTAKNGTISKIVPTLPPGSAVSTHKNDTDMIVTEHGVAKMQGRTIRQRTRALISIAHPEFREELEHEAKKMGYL
jgi:acyl-CoA hydrolase